MKSVTIHVPEVYLRDIDQLVNSNYYPNRAEVIRVAIRDLISSEVWSKIKASNEGVKEYDAFDFGEKD
jgi:Arc/MetJ-type ribon-helix-helix transcriptional regulator